MDVKKDDLNYMAIYDHSFSRWRKSKMTRNVLPFRHDGDKGGIKPIAKFRYFLRFCKKTITFKMAKINKLNFLCFRGHFREILALSIIDYNTEWLWWLYNSPAAKDHIEHMEESLPTFKSSSFSSSKSLRSSHAFCNASTSDATIGLFVCSFISAPDRRQSNINNKYNHWQ